jgi:hypothetical protein
MRMEVVGIYSAIILSEAVLINFKKYIVDITSKV